MKLLKQRKGCKRSERWGRNWGGAEWWRQEINMECEMQQTSAITEFSLPLNQINSSHPQTVASPIPGMQKETSKRREFDSSPRHILPVSKPWYLVCLVVLIVHVTEIRSGCISFATVYFHLLQMVPFLIKSIDQVKIHLSSTAFYWSYSVFDPTLFPKSISTFHWLEWS